MSKKNYNEPPENTYLDIMFEFSILEKFITSPVFHLRKQINETVLFKNVYHSIFKILFIIVIDDALHPIVATFQKLRIEFQIQIIGFFVQITHIHHNTYHKKFLVSSYLLKSIPFGWKSVYQQNILWKT